jgi:hypothetical protein
LNANNLYYKYANGSGTSQFTAINFFTGLDSQWIHIVVVCDYNNKKAYGYRNGVQFGVTQDLVGTPVFPSINNSKYFGDYSSGHNYPLTDGSLDEVRVYNRGLSAEEVSAHYTITKGKFGL